MVSFDPPCRKTYVKVLSTDMRYYYTPTNTRLLSPSPVVVLKEADFGVPFSFCFFFST